ncbi:MAG: TfoX/Sxy family protein [Gammaproteobacteria bacterium]|nr:TfoX/Sxy family protein [Gammaproteobacteria bacterium]
MSTQDYLEYVLELLREVDGITYKKMMGEYILYKDGIIFGGIYDNRFLVKKVNSIIDYEFKEETPYPGAKSMYLIDIENPKEIEEIVYKILKDLK